MVIEYFESDSYHFIIGSYVEYHNDLYIHLMVNKGYSLMVQFLGVIKGFFRF